MAALAYRYDVATCMVQLRRRTADGWEVVAEMTPRDSLRLAYQHHEVNNLAAASQAASLPDDGQDEVVELNTVEDIDADCLPTFVRIAEDGSASVTLDFGR